MNAIYQLLNPDNTISLNRPLAHAVGLMETVVYSALIAKWQYCGTWQESPLYRP